MSYREETLTVRDRHVRLMRAGIGQPLLYLHDTLSYTWTPVHDALAEHYEVIFPIHPGCAGSGELDNIEDMDESLERIWIDPKRCFGKPSIRGT